MSASARQWLVALAIVVLVAGAVAILLIFNQPSAEPREFVTRRENPLDRLELPDTAEMEPRVRRVIEDGHAAVTKDSKSANAWRELGAVLDAHRLFAPAAQCYRESLSLHPSDFATTYYLAIVSEGLVGGLDAAVELFQQAISLRSAYTAAHIRLGDALLKQGNPQAARDAYLAALELQPQSARAHRGVGQTLLAIGDVSEAVLHLEAAAQSVPTDGPTHAALAQAYSRLGNAQRGEDAADLSRQHGPAIFFEDPVRREVLDLGVSSLVARQRARQFMDSGEYAAAIDDLKIVEEVRGDDPGIQLMMGMCYARLGREAAARDHLTYAIELNEELVAARLELAGLLAMERRFEDALAHIRRALETEPQNTTARAQLAATLAQNGQLSEAIDEFEEAATLGPLAATAHLNWGSTLRQLNKSAEAIAHFERAIELHSDYAAAHYALGIVLESQNRIDEAIAHYRHAVRIAPGHPAAKRLEGLVDSR